MKIALRWKISLLFAVLSLLILLPLYAYLRQAVQRHEIQLLAAEMLTQARLVAAQLPQEKKPSAASWQKWAQQIEESVQARVTVIGPEGDVWADSHENPAVMDNHANRPERLEALEKGYGFTVRYSQTLQCDMLYVAVRASKRPEAEAIIVRLARPLVSIYASQAHLRHSLALAFLVAVLGAWLGGLLASQQLSRALKPLLRAAQRIREGDLEAHVEKLSAPELEELGEAFTAATASLRKLLKTTQRESRFYSAILQQMSDAVIIVDHEGLVQFINSACARLFNLQPQEVEGRSAEQVALSFELSSLLRQALAQGAVLHDEVRLLQPQPRYLATVVTPLFDEAGRIIGAVGLLHEVTELRRMDEVRREFVANASHELRTPAAGIKALAEALQMGALHDPEKGPRFVAQIVEAADRLTAILDDMLTLTRVERGQQLFKPEKVNVRRLAEEIGEQLRLKAEEKQISLEIAVAAQDTVWADPEGLHTVLLNLVDNALKYTPANGRVIIEGRANSQGYELSVSDTGIGIPAEHLPRIFERFYRVDKARDRASGGTGLGLAIVKHIVEAHKGRVDVRSTPGQGSTFTVYFPFPQAS